MGDRLAAEYIIHRYVDRYKHGYLLGADRCADAAKSHDIEQNISKASIRRSLFPVCSWRHRLV
jgi:hypothetical protein